MSNKPDWKDAPEWAMWWAMDEDGDCFWYERQPISGEFSWYHRGEEVRGEWEEAPPMSDDVNWKETLEPRP